MKNITSVNPWHLGVLQETEYDCFIGTIGYETRAIFFASEYELNASKRIAIGFSHNNVMHYKKNLAWYSDNAFEIHTPKDNEEFKVLANRYLQELLSYTQEHTDRSVLNICIDISSITRYRLATWIEALRKLDTGAISVTVDFVYSRAKFSSPPHESIINRSIGPLPGFAGWASPNLPLTVVVGVGYEPDKALGSVLFLDPADCWAFIPAGHHKNYSDAIESANEQLWEFIDPKKKIFYDVQTPFNNYLKLDAFVYGALKTNRVVLLPFGPKTFVLSCLLLACQNTKVGVWHVKSAKNTEPLDREPNGKVIGLRACIG